ncbi:MAG: radical SAM protein, partial [Spirochaetales bacterium]
KTGLFDFVFRGEAEETLAALLSLLVEGGSRAGNAVSGALSVPVAGVIAADSWKTGNGRIPEPAFVENLDSLSSPFLDGTLNLPSYGGLLWELSRGCPFGCHFCYESRGKLGVRVFSLERLERELEVFAGAGVAQVYVLDPTFNVNGKRAKNILELIRRKAPSIHFTFEARSEYLDPELAALFSSVSCSVQIGLQSAHPEVLVHVGRNMDRDDFYEKVLLLHEAEVVYGFDLMYGLPGDSLDGFCESLDFALEMRPNHLDIFPLAVLPGTRLAEEASDFGLVWIPGPPYTVLSTPSMNSSDMNEAQKIAEACEQLYNKGGAVAWFSMVTEALSLRPSGLIMEFSAWSGTHRASLFESLRSFVQSLFDRAGKKAQGRVAADIISYFHDTDDPSVLPFYHDPAELGAYLESGIDNIEELLLLVPKNPHDTA